MIQLFRFCKAYRRNIAVKHLSFQPINGENWNFLESIGTGEPATIYGSLGFENAKKIQLVQISYFCKPVVVYQN